jgi:starch phosphorylase
MKPLRRITVGAALPEALAPLRVLASNLHSTWDPHAQALFSSIDSEGFEAAGRNALRLLNQVPAERLEALAQDQEFLGRLNEAAGSLERLEQQPRWWSSLADPPKAIAYFSPEFGVSEVLPQYSGGLGVLAGDHLKAASDLGVPLYGVGLFYRNGYFSQHLSADGMQQERYPALDPDELPMELARDAAGEPLRVRIQFPGAVLHAQIWQVLVGTVTLLLLDADVPENAPAERAVTDRLYGGGSEHRLRQELLLGVGGVRALDAFGVEAEVFHTNEGHAGFLGLERLRKLLEQGLDREAAFEAVRAGTVFTTHTPVPAGIDRFGRDLIERYFSLGAVDVGLTVDEIMGLGRDPEHGDVTFNMAVMGLRLAQRSNGVSRLHGAVSRSMFSPVWPGLDAQDVPIAHITNGVHAGTWIAPPMTELLADKLGEDFGVAERSWDGAADLDDARLWEVRNTLRAGLIAEIRQRLRASWRRFGVLEGQLGWVDQAFDPDVLTIGFARRVPSYKRLTLILRQPERLRALLLDDTRPIQLAVAGKAHPADEQGKRLLQQFAEFASDADVRHRIVFLPDYDMGMATTLVSGADVWLNNPLRPFEACGTSGMKAALNGALNLSIRDGWWDELYDGANGWAIPSADETVDPDRRDDFEATAILDLLENQVRTLFYDRDNGVPHGWLEMVKHSLASLGPPLLATRMVRDYVEQLYVPATRSARKAQADGFAGARDLSSWKHRVHAAWPGVSVREVELVSNGGFRAGERRAVRAVVDLAGLSPDEVEVSVAYGRVDDAEELEGPQLLRLQAAGDADRGTRFEGDLPISLAGSFGYAVRVAPSRDGEDASQELGLVRWARG